MAQFTSQPVVVKSMKTSTICFFAGSRTFGVAVAVVIAMVVQVRARMLRSLMEPLNRSRETAPAIPATEPADEYCQNRQLCHPVGIFGQATPHAATNRWLRMKSE